MSKKNQNKDPKEITASDYGPAERQQHGLYVEIETPIAGIKALRNTTIDPIETYKSRGSISNTQYIAADIFAAQYRRAHLAATYAQVRYDNAPGGGEMPLEAVEAIQLSKQRVRDALAHVGAPLSGIIEYVVGEGSTAGSWKGVKMSKRPEQDGMVALRLALDGLVGFYKVV
jgi:hypothetical protein